MPDLNKLRNLKKTLSIELERRPSEERERMKNEAARLKKLREGWESEFPWCPISELSPAEEADFLQRLEVAVQKKAELDREGRRAWLTAAPDAEDPEVRGPHVIAWL